jgi:CubicO group peptidase (beta-lactamase class C family)
MSQNTVPVSRRTRLQQGARAAAAGAAAQTIVLLATACGPAADLRSQAEAGAPAACTAEVELADALRQIDSMLVQRSAAERIPGMAAGVVCGGEMVWAGGYGVMASDDPRPVTTATRFRIASITKLFTATAVMRLNESRALGLDDDIRDHLPWFSIRRTPETGDAAVTIRQLLTHTSGMPRDSRLTDFDRLFQPVREEAIAALPTQALRDPPGTRFSYSNLGYGVLGEVIGQVSGVGYANYLRNEILLPLGMVESLVHPTPEDDVAWGHGPRGGDGSRTKAGFWALGFATPAGGMAASVRDLGRFMVLHLAPYADDEPEILSPESLREMHAVQHMIDPRRGGVGLGWAVETSNEQHVIYHGGELPEQVSFLLIDLRAHIGVVVLANAQDADASAVAQEVLRLVRTALDPTAIVPIEAIPRG